jgi:ubiquinone/menaquinone biosynthesis C-methylase UbiE
VGVERSDDAVELARRFAVDHDLANVEVLCRDARATGLPRNTFDLATARLVLVNIPRPEEVVTEMVALVRPGGVVALHPRLQQTALRAAAEPQVVSPDRPDDLEDV